MKKQKIKEELFHICGMYYDIERLDKNHWRVWHGLQNTAFESLPQRESKEAAVEQALSHARGNLASMALEIVAGLQWLKDWEDKGEM